MKQTDNRRHTKLSLNIGLLIVQFKMIGLNYVIIGLGIYIPQSTPYIGGYVNLASKHYKISQRHKIKKNVFTLFKVFSKLYGLQNTSELLEIFLSIWARIPVGKEFCQQ